VKEKITRALIVRKPYIDQILDGIKTWEMRSTATRIRGRIALIEGGSGLIVGECRLVDSSKPLDVGEFGFYRHEHRIYDESLLIRWPHPWILKDAKRYHEPIPYKHPAGAVIWVDLGKLGVELPPKQEPTQ